MFKCVAQIPSALFAIEPVVLNQIRTTFVVKRRWPPGLHKTNGKPKPLRGRHYVYDLVCDTNIQKQPNLDVILTSYVSGFGQAGDRISLKPNTAYNKFLLPGLAVYATPTNELKYQNHEVHVESEHSSAFAQRTVEKLTKFKLNVSMNMDNPWILEPWHVRASFRKSGYEVPVDAIMLPDKKICGPDLALEGKMFYVIVKVNNLETVRVRCLLHHWSSQITERLPFCPNFWNKSIDPLFPEDMAVLNEIETESMKLHK